MDIVSLATSAVMAKAMSRADIVAAKIIKDNAGSEQAVAELLAASQDNMERLVDGLGARVDVTV